uniref:ATP synthase subunit a n=1 Tax=Pedetontus silvestrii TaxID=518099 RepID=B7SSK7_9INSE|nr:ATP synthase F0 subunit 6 [Pedetontus silvestrii]ACC60219.1 ATP synthase F0 subunit 6 [Pedetontus silvestrii]
MMTNLFSVFDPTTKIFNLNLNWSSTILGLLILPYTFWFLPTRMNILWTLMIMILHKEFKILMEPKGHPGSSVFFVTLFSLIMFNNFLGLFPYIFTSTSHMILTLTLALPLWLSFMLYGWINHTQHMFAHLIPQGTPPILMPFMVCIETISNMIRPGTLAIRLAANMIAGHLLLTLLGSTGPSMNSALVCTLMIGQILLLILEVAVAIIQSYVFAILSTLYSSEVN